jgi:ketosteroid isomerase-like protein
VVAETIYALEADGLALLRGKFTVSYTDEEQKPQRFIAETVEVARRGRDGQWRFIIDHPNGASEVGGM